MSSYTSFSFYDDEMSSYSVHTPYSMSSIARSNSSQGSASTLSPSSMSSPLSPGYTRDYHDDDWKTYRAGSWTRASHGSNSQSPMGASWEEPAFAAFDYTYGAESSSYVGNNAYSPSTTVAHSGSGRSGSGSGSNSGQAGAYLCLYADCPSNGFKRKADLDRHIKNCHLPVSMKESYYCDYPRCGRRDEPFHRRDHFRDHLREFHKEDIEKRGSSASNEFYESRNVKQDWWRCSRCLDKVTIKTHGYDCPKCKSQCNDKRQKLRSSGSSSRR